MRLRLTNIFGCLLAGAAINVLASWLVAMSIPCGPNGNPNPSPDDGYRQSVPSGLGPPTRSFHVRGFGNAYWQVQWDGPVEDSSQDDAVMNLYHFGIPFLSLKMRHIYIGPRYPSNDKSLRTGTIGAIPMPPWRPWLMIDRTPGTQYASDLPWIPVWRGFLGNTVIYTMCSIVLVKIFSSSRRLYRVHRGCCPVCAYDIAGLAACPECGWPLNTKVFKQSE